MEPGKDIMTALLVVLSVSLLVPAAWGASSGPTDGRSVTRQTGDGMDQLDFNGTIVYKEMDLLYRAASGDILPEVPGNEVATCSRNGVIAVTYGSDLSWTTEVAWRSSYRDNLNEPVHVYSIAVADLIPERPGDEIVTVDMDDSIDIAWKDGKEWMHETIFRDTEPAQQMWLYEVAVGEVPGTTAGTDIVAVGDAGRTFLATRVGSIWETSLIYTDPQPLDTCTIVDVIPERQGNEIIVGGTSGNISLLSWDGTSFGRETIASLGSNIMDLTCTDLDPTKDGMEVFSTTFSKDLYMTYRTEGEWMTERIHHEGAPIYGIEAGKIDGKDVISMATWSNRIALIYHDSGFKVKEVYRDDFYMMGTGIFDIDPYHQGNEVVGLSYYGRLHMFYHDGPGADLMVPFTECVVTANEKVAFPLIVRYKGGFEGKVDLKVSGTGASLSASSMDREGLVELRLTAPSTVPKVKVQISASTTFSTVTKEISFTVNETGGSMDFDRHTISLQVGSDRQFRGTFELLSNKDMGTPFVLESDRTPMGLRLDLAEAVCDPLGTPITLSYTITAEPWLRPATYHFFLTGSLFDDRARAIGFAVKVTESSISDFILSMDEDRITAMEGAEVSVGILLQSISGFSDEVVLSVPDSIDGLNISFSETRVVPTSRTILRIRIVEGPGPFFIRVVGTGGNLTREDILRLDTTPQGGSITIIGPVAGPRFEPADGGFISSMEVTLVPINGPVEIATIALQGLPEDIEASISPSDLRTLPYRLNLTITLRTGKDPDGPISFFLNVTSEDALRSTMIELEVMPYAGSDDRNGSDLLVGIIMIILVSVGIISGIAVLYLVGRRLSAYGGSGDQGRVHKKGQRGHPHVPPIERAHGLGRGTDWMVRKR